MTYVRLRVRRTEFSSLLQGKKRSGLLVLPRETAADTFVSENMKTPPSVVQLNKLVRLCSCTDTLHLMTDGRKKLTGTGNY
jgi:hypothetical protein